jgi:hypothetical protein
MDVRRRSVSPESLDQVAALARGVLLRLAVAQRAVVAMSTALSDAALESLDEWFAADVYEQQVGLERIAVIRAGVDASPLWTGRAASGRSLAEVVNENYRVLLRRIAELEADINELIKE